MCNLHTNEIVSNLGKLCNDMFNYINKNDWMKDVTGRCELKCKKLKLILEGQDDPNYDANAVQAPQRPLKGLSDVLSGGFKRAQLGSYWCDTNTYEDKSGCINIEITIDVKEEKCVCNDVCANVLAYLTRPGILDRSTHTCEFVSGCTDKVLLHFVADE